MCEEALSRYIESFTPVTCNTSSNLEAGRRLFCGRSDDSAQPVFRLGTQATEELALLAENGSPAELVALFTGATGVETATSEGAGTLVPGELLTIDVCLPFPMYLLHPWPLTK